MSSLSNQDDELSSEDDELSSEDDELRNQVSRGCKRVNDEVKNGDDA